MAVEQNICVAAYARVSTEHGDQINSLTSQKSYFANYISKQQGMKLSKVYYDEGISGTQTKNRRGFKQMIDDALCGKFKLILTKEVSRFARNTVDTLFYTRKLKEAGIGVIFTIDNIDTRDSDGELRLTIMASLAQEESRKTSERVKWGQKRRMEQGVVFGRDLLGYVVKNGELYVNEAEVPVVRAVFHKYTNEGKGTQVIARELLEEGHRPKYITRWSNTVILRVLRNEKYVGDLCQKKTYTPDYLTHKKKYNRGQEEKVYIKNHHEGIIERDLWNRTQEELKKRSNIKEKKKRYSNSYWCSGKICCGECGSHFVCRTKKLQNENYRAWQCCQKAIHGSFKNLDGQAVGCDNRAVNEKALFTSMQFCVNLICKNKDMIRKEVLYDIKKACSTQEKTIDISKIRQKAEIIQEKKRRAFDAMLDGLLSKDDLKKQTKWYNDELACLWEIMEKSEKNDECCNVKYKKNELLENSLNEILELGGKNEMLYGEITDKIIVYRENEKRCSRLVIWLKTLPFGIQLRIRSTGKGKDYRTEILESIIVERKEISPENSCLVICDD